MQSESVGDGDNGDATLRICCKGSGIGAIVPTQLLVSKRSAVEPSNLEGFNVWKKETEESDSDHAAPASSSANPPKMSVRRMHDTDDADPNEDEDRNDSAQAALNKVLTYQTMKEQTGMGNAELLKTTLGVRHYALRATCVRATRFVTMRTVWCIISCVDFVPTPLGRTGKN